MGTWIMAFETSARLSKARTIPLQRLTHPKVRPTTQRRGRTLKPGSASILRTISITNSSNVVHEFSAIIGAIGEDMFDPRQRLRMASRIYCAPAELETSAVVRLTMSGNPSASTAMWRLPPLIFSPAS